MLTCRRWWPDAGCSRTRRRKEGIVAVEHLAGQKDVRFRSPFASAKLYLLHPEVSSVGLTAGESEGAWIRNVKVFGKFPMSASARPRNTWRRRRLR